MKGVVVLIGLSFALLLVSCTGPYYLEVSDGQSGAIVKRFLIQEDEPFTVKFIHSVERAPILESFYIDHLGNIILKEVKFKKIGVGYGKYIPTLYPSTQKGDWYYMSDIEAPVILKYRVGYVANHTLVVRGEEYPFSEMVPPGELLKIVPTRIPRDSLKKYE